MEENKVKIFEKVILIEILLVVFLLPLFFLPLSLTNDFLNFSKNIFLMTSALVITVSWLFKMVLEKKVSFRKTPFDLPIFGIILSFILSTVLASPAKIESLLIPGGTGTILAFALLYFIITNNLKEEKVNSLIHALMASACILSLWAIANFIGLLQNLIPWEFLKAKAFTPAGSLLALLGFLLVSTILVFFRVYVKWQKNPKAFTFIIPHAIGLLVMASGIGVISYELFALVKPIFLPQQTGWQIAIEALKLVPFFGVGPENFLAAFNQFRPLSYNSTSVWNVAFDASSNYFFQTWTTVGTLGLASLLFLVWQILREVKILGKTLEDKTAFLTSLLVLLFLFCLLPQNFLILFAFFLFLALFALYSPANYYQEESRILPWTLFLPITLLSLAGLYLIGRSALAELQFQKSLEAYLQNDGMKTYNNQVAAINLNPYRVNYHLAYSQTNLALANSLASQKDLSDQDRQNISTLIQQAIREAKTAVALNPQNARSWENLASLYRQLINFAEGANQWTIAAYQQTITLDPTNPFLRITLGGVYYASKDWDQALRLFEQTIATKPDMANAHYNLSAVYLEKGDFEKAASEMQATLNLVPLDSEDWKKANRELEAIQKRLKEKSGKAGKTQTQSETLQTPQPLPTGIKPPLELPTGSAPEITPTPTEITPTPTVSQ